MGIYIKGVEMPKSCDECLFSINGWCIAKFGIDTAIIYDDCRHPDCPLVEVKVPHSALIEQTSAIINIKNIEEEPKYQHDGEDWIDGLVQAEEAVRYVPTIIEKEEKDNV